MANHLSDPILTNVTFSGNSAAYGGGIFNDNSEPLLTHVTISGNTATNGHGGGIYNENGYPELINTIVWRNEATDLHKQIANIYSSETTIHYSVVQGGCPNQSTCDHVITADPKLYELGDYGGFTPTIPLRSGSPAIDAASDSDCPATDQHGVTRPQGARCDIGAYEAILKRDTYLPLIIR